MHYDKQNEQSKLTQASPRRIVKPEAPRQVPGATIGHRSPAALLVLQRSAGNAAVVQLLAQAEAKEEHQHGHDCGHRPVQRSSVDQVLRSDGAPLPSDKRADMEARLGADFSEVRLHSDASARASAAEMGARAYTSGNHVVLGEGGGDNHTLAHELTHVIQQRQGPVAGTDSGNGLSVSDPSDRFEREAEANATRAMQLSVDTSRRHVAHAAASSGVGHASVGTPIQRYRVVQQGGPGYPQVAGSSVASASTGAGHFPSQQENEHGSHFVDPAAEPLQANIVYDGSVQLRISDNMDLAIEDSVEAKSFYATEKQIAAANKKLKGKVTLVATSRQLRISTGRRSVNVLRQVFPSVPSKGQQGLDVTTPQRCNEMAEFVSGAQGVSVKAIQQWEDTLVAVCDRVEKSNRHSRGQAEAKAAVADNDTASFLAWSNELSGTYQQLLEERPEEVKKALKKLDINEYLAPKIGVPIATVGYGTAEQEAHREANRGSYFDYHFGTPVVVSGGDYITMENYARRDEFVGNRTASRGDPLFFFRMLGTDKAQTWHREVVGGGGYLGAILSIRLS